MSALEGTRLGAYELMERVGEGGMAEVYRAKQLSAFGREVALKVIRREFTGDEAFRRRFLREAHAISRLSHPNILPLIEFGDERGLLYLIMPLVREGTLRDLLSKHRGPLSIEEALPLFVPLCDAVQYAHQEDIIHRDIKPQNVLLQRYTHVLLADFGIARDRFDTHLTTTGVGIGSVEYMAPEQAEGKGDARSDIYSLGIVLYQMLTGVMPYAGTMPLEVLLKKASEPAPDARAFNPRLPAEIADMLRMALARDPNQRFESAGALGQAVRQIVPHCALAPSPGQMIWQPGLPAPAPASDFAATVQRRPAQQDTRLSQDFDTLPTRPSSSAALAPTYQFDSPPPAYPGSPADGRADQPARSKHGLLMVALVAALLLALGVSTIAYGHLGLPWLHPGTANTGAQLLTPTPSPTPQPTQIPAPVNTPLPGGGKPTSSTPTPQPTATPTPQPTATPQPTDTPTPQPTPTPTPGATGTPTPQPTPTPSPQGGTADQPGATPTPAPAPTSPPDNPSTSGR